MTAQAGAACLILLTAGALTACASRPQPAPGRSLGFGTPGVESYVSPARRRDLAALLERCREVAVTPGPPPPQTLAAACDELHRTMRNQPGNAD